MLADCNVAGVRPIPHDTRADFLIPLAANPGTIVPVTLSGAGWTRLAVLHFFRDPIPRECLRLWLLGEREWQNLLYWLDVSGLALYFAARLQEKELGTMLPGPVRERLQKNLVDNERRTADMVAESTAIQRDFQSKELSYAVLKGFSLWPHSVPRLELRSQLDLDFLIAERNASEARRILEKRGYRLHAISGRSWEFMTDGPPGALSDLYRFVPHRSVELHLEATNTGPELLARVEHVPFHGISVPVLAPADLFLGQGLHLYKHVCSESWRAAHLLEFRRHIMVRNEETGFWDQVRERGEQSVRTSLGLGVVLLLIERATGGFAAPESLTRWTVDRLSPNLRSWVDRYGLHSATMGCPGNKLYLLLQSEMEALGAGSRRSVQQALLPRRLPPAIELAGAGEAFPKRAQRLARQFRFVLQRLRFHIFAGLGYRIESRRWKRLAAIPADSPVLTKQ